MASFSASLTSVRQMEVTLRDARIAAGITQAQLAKQIGVSRPWINQFEQGKIGNPSFQRVMAIVNALRVAVTVTYEVSDRKDTNADANVAAPSRPEGSVPILVPNAKLHDFDDILLALAERSVANHRQAAALNGKDGGAVDGQN